MKRRRKSRGFEGLARRRRVVRRQKIALVLATILVFSSVIYFGAGHIIKEFYQKANAETVIQSSSGNQLNRVSWNLVILQKEANAAKNKAHTKAKDKTSNKGNKNPEKKTDDKSAITNNKVSNLKKAVFVGDSITEGLIIFDFVKPTQVVSAKGLTAKDAYKRVNEIIKKKPEQVYILVGVNDITYKNNNLKGHIKEYDKLIKALKKALPNTTIYAQSVLPVTSKYEAANKKRGISNKNIDEYNKQLKLIAAKNKIVYLDIAKVFKDNNGELPIKKSSDGLHLYKPYYKEWIDQLVK